MQIQEKDRKPGMKENVAMFAEYLKMSEVYQAFHLVNKYLEETYGTMITSSLLNESTFNAARFLVNNLPNSAKSP